MRNLTNVTIVIRGGKLQLIFNGTCITALVTRSLNVLNVTRVFIVHQASNNTGWYIVSSNPTDVLSVIRSSGTNVTLRDMKESIVV